MSRARLVTGGNENNNTYYRTISLAIIANHGTELLFRFARVIFLYELMKLHYGQIFERTHTEDSEKNSDVCWRKTRILSSGRATEQIKKKKILLA